MGVESAKRMSVVPQEETSSFSSEPRNMSFVSVHSSSTESDDTWYGWSLNDDDYELELYNEDDEAESWTNLVNSMVLRRLNTRDKKRQCVIHELIQTETDYVRTLFIMKEIYHDGIKKKLNISDEDLATIFPALEDILDLNRNFLRDLKVEQKADDLNYSISRFGNIILKHFDNNNGKQFCKVYGYFCSRHHEAIALFKEYCRERTDFQEFNEKCLSNINARRLSVPECITYMSVRLTKYPLLIEAIIKGIPENSSDHNILTKCLMAVKQVLANVDSHIDVYEKEQQLLQIRKQIDYYSIIKTRKNYGMAQLFEAYNIIPRTAKLMYDKYVKYRSGQRLYDVRMVIVTKKIIFFQEQSNTKKLQLLDLKNKPSELLLREVINPEENAAAARLADENAVFIVTKKDIVEVLFDQKIDQSAFIAKLSETCGSNKLTSTEKESDDENTSTDTEEESKQMEEEKRRQAKELINRLHDVEKKIRLHLHFKNRLCQKLQEIFVGESTGNAYEVSMKPIPDIDIFSTKAKLELLLMKVDDILSIESSQENTLPDLVPTHFSTVNTAKHREASKNSIRDQETYDCPRRDIIKARPRSAAFDLPVWDGDNRAESPPLNVRMRDRMPKRWKTFMHSSRLFPSHDDISSTSSASPSNRSKFIRQNAVRTRPMSETVDSPRNIVTNTESAHAEESRLRRMSRQVKSRMRLSKLFVSDEDISSGHASPASSDTNFILPSSASVQVYQHLSGLLNSTIELTNQQDMETAKMQEELLRYRFQSTVGEEEEFTLPRKLQKQERSETERRRKRDIFKAKVQEKIARSFKRFHDKI